MVYTTIGYFLLIFFVLDLVFAGGGVFDLLDISSWGLLNSEIIFSASLEFISFEERLIFDLIS